ncbi:CDF family Co(II)/Ni(II) efflux transporter DmeF [Xanthobacter sp. KR7-225]|uniref:CDF family Co(II)/Ni(II) efflux transporter DmeF n=1 Tax=Xanthobacter sp. KR7-225 TaxID=3156613 RepID=UPI0032B4F2A7
MIESDVAALRHDHVFLGADHRRNERKVWFVIVLTTVMMVVEIVAGTLYGSMALVADGWHMSTHAGAMLIAALAYLYARRLARDPRFTFGTGKLGDLAGFASAVALALVALLIGWESFLRFADPVPISFTQAIGVAVVGLAVNLVSALLLRDAPHHHGHSHDHDHHRHDDHHHHADARAGHGQARDNNLRAAYLHVLADALTSVLAIVALLLGGAYGWLWADPLMGLAGALVIARWSWGLVHDAGRVLLDMTPADADWEGEIRSAIEDERTRITDLHVWQLGPGHAAAIVALTGEDLSDPAYYKARIRGICALAHITVEVQSRPAQSA